MNTPVKMARIVTRPNYENIPGWREGDVVIIIEVWTQGEVSTALDKEGRVHVLSNLQRV
jgi:hypothetical protein